MGKSPQNLPHPDALERDQSIQIWMPSKHMGNLLLSLRTIAALVNYYGASRSVLIVDDRYRDIILASGIDCPVIPFPRKQIDASGAAGKAARALSFIRQTRRRKPAIGIAVEGDKVSQRFLPLSGCRVLAGPDNRYCKRAGIKLALDHHKTHVFYDYEAVARQITGEPLAPGYVPLTANPRARAQVAQLLESGGENKPYAILHPCATKDYKQWPAESFARLAEHFSAAGMTVVITGAGEFDGRTIDHLKAISRCPLLSLHNQLGLQQLIALMNNARFFVGNDTGPAHLAGACGISTFAIFGPTDESLWGPLGDNTHVLRSKVPCEPDCLRRKCNVGYRCMHTLDTGSVIKAIEQWL